MIKFSLFKNNRSKEPLQIISFDQFVEDTQGGKWRKAVEKLRSTTKESKRYKLLKSKLHAVTISGLFKSRDEQVPFVKRFKGHTGLIAIDIDKKDNPLLKASDVIDKDSLMEYVSCSGEGKKIIYKCVEVDNPKEHRRIFDAVIARLENKGLKINVDPIVKSISSLQYVSYDPALYYNPNSKVVIHPLPPINITKVKARSPNVKEDLMQLEDYVEVLGDKDITTSYEDWMIIMFGLSYSLGEEGRALMHRICSSYYNYSEEECNDKYDSCLERPSGINTDKPVTVASVFQLINNALPKVKLRKLSKKYSVTHAIPKISLRQKTKASSNEAEDLSEAEIMDQPDLHGMVRFKLFLFKKIIDKETNEVIELKPSKINLNTLELMLREMGFFRYEFNRVKYVQIIDNIVESVDVADILRLLTVRIENEGDYNFTYRRVEYFFSWEEIALLWREVRAMGTTWNQIAASLQHWVPNLLKDTSDTSYVPYKNGVVTVTAKDIELVSFGKLNKQIWKERIIDREFKLTKKAGMFEEFFINVTGRGRTPKERESHMLHKRSLWYFGYMLQAFKRKSMARAWLLYDIKAGNSGRSGKSIMGQAIGKIRSMVTIDGKQLDLKNRFAFQVITPWTDVVFIDDPSKFMSIVPLFNMITGTLYADKKGIDPIEIEAKLMFASNWILEQEGSSEIGRQFVTQIDDFYVKYGKENGDSLTPIVDYHGKEFFTDWNVEDWSKFDSFCMKALNYYLKEKAPENTIIGNAGQLRFIQVNEEEMFYELCNTFVNNVKVGKDGDWFIVQGLLVAVIKEANADLKNVKAGRIARDFLGAIGAKKIEISSLMVNNMAKSAYKLVGCTASEINVPEQFSHKLAASLGIALVEPKSVAKSVVNSKSTQKGRSKTSVKKKT